jgi:hypothetical protein
MSASPANIVFSPFNFPCASSTHGELGKTPVLSSTAQKLLGKRVKLSQVRTSQHLPRADSDLV